MKSKLFGFAAAVLCLYACPAFAQTSAAQAYAITNARIVTVSGPVIEKGTVVVRAGLIDSVGAAIRPPADAQMIDATGLTVYPGFIDALTIITTSAPARPTGGPASAGPQPTPQSNSNYPEGLRPEEDAFDELKAGDAQFETSRNSGFTTAVAVGRTGLFNGRSVIIDLGGEKISEMVIKTPFAEHVSFVTLSSGAYPTSLMGTFSALRQMLLDSQRLKEIQRLYAANPRGINRPGADPSLQALIPVIDREVPVVFNANSEIEIIRALDLVKEFKLRAMIAGGQEAWKVTDRLKALDVPVLLSLNFPKRTTVASPEADPESLDVLRLRAEAPKGAARLAQAGVRFAFQSDAMKSLGDFFLNAGKAVENGLNRDAAIRAMTLGSAEILGVDDRLGSIEPGKIANLTVVKGDLLGKDRAVTHVIVDGRLYEQKLPAKASATTTPGGAVMVVGGNYSITISVPGQPIPATLALIQQGPLLSGTFQSQMGTTPIKDGKVTAEGFEFGGTAEFGGSTIDIIVKGTVTGNQISGTIDSPQGPVTFSGTRNP